MKKLFLPFLLLASFTLPTTASAESVWLVLEGWDSSFVKIETKDMTECELMGAKWLSTKRIKTHPNNRGFECFKGK